MRVFCSMRHYSSFTKLFRYDIERLPAKYFFLEKSCIAYCNLTLSSTTYTVYNKVWTGLSVIIIPRLIVPDLQCYSQSVICSGDSLANSTNSYGYHNGQRFSARDRDYDSWDDDNCAQMNLGAWWFKSCMNSHLNGIYVDGGWADQFQGIFWYSWKGGRRYSLKRTEMKIGPNQ